MERKVSMYQRIEWILLTKVHHSIGVTNKGRGGRAEKGLFPGAVGERGAK